MLMPLAAALLLQGSVTINIGGGTPDSAAQHASRLRSDSIAAERREEYRRRYDEREVRRIPLTPALLESAFRSPGARDVLERGRRERLRVDSTLKSYDAIARERVATQLQAGRLAPSRRLVLHDVVSRVRWNLEEGAWIDVEGSRTITQPGVNADMRTVGQPWSIPHYPGRDALWLGATSAREEVDERRLVHPLGEGAEAYYRYALGDTVQLRLSPTDSVQIVELRVQPREPRWNVIVGSLWFDMARGSLVQATYRPAVPAQLANDGDSSASIGERILSRMLPSGVGTVDFATLEYGLHRVGEDMLWLPRVQSGEGEVQFGAMRVRVRAETEFTYSNLNVAEPAQLPKAPACADSLVLVRRVAEQEGEARLWAYCDDGDAGITALRRGRAGLPVVVRRPKDEAALAASPLLPPLTEEDERLTPIDHAEIERALGIGRQALWSPQRPKLHLGLNWGLLRYNRIEGLSAGAGLEQQLGAGFSARALARIGTADRHVNGEAQLIRTAAGREIRLAGYERLASATTRENPLGIGNSLNAFLFGRDEGLYFRARGAELVATVGSPTLTWRFFAERQRPAAVGTNLSVPNLISSTRVFSTNIVADEATLFGSGMEWHGSRGVDPLGLRGSHILRIEGAGGDFTFGRAELEATVARPLVGGLDLGLTGAVGSSVGNVPAQRLWYLGGMSSIRGQPFASGAGEAYWLGRTELGWRTGPLKPVMFYDIGMAGDRGTIWSEGRPMSGAGAGISLLDGLLRLDIARGVSPARSWRGGLTLGAAF